MRQFKLALEWRDVANAVLLCGDKYVSLNLVDAASSIRDWLPRHGHFPHAWQFGAISVHESGATVDVVAPDAPGTPALRDAGPGDYGTCNACGLPLSRPIPDFLCDGCRRAEHAR